MTPEERVDRLFGPRKEGGASIDVAFYRHATIAVIREAIEEEREACAKIVEDNRFCDEAITTAASEIRARK